MLNALQAFPNNYRVREGNKKDWDEMVTIIARLERGVSVTHKCAERGYAGTLKIKGRVILRVLQAINSLVVSNVITDDSFSTAKIQSEFKRLFKKHIGDVSVTIAMSVLADEELAYKHGPNYGLWFKGMRLAEVLYKLAARNPSYAEYTRQSLSPTIS